MLLFYSRWAADSKHSRLPAHSLRWWSKLMQIWVLKHLSMELLVLLVVASPSESLEIRALFAAITAHAQHSTMVTHSVSLLPLPGLVCLEKTLFVLSIKGYSLRNMLFYIYIYISILGKLIFRRKLNYPALYFSQLYEIDLNKARRCVQFTLEVRLGWATEKKEKNSVTFYKKLCWAVVASFSHTANTDFTFINTNWISSWFICLMVNTFVKVYFSP